MRSAVAPGVLPVIALDRRTPTPLYRQLCEAYRQAIVERRLPAGQRLPSTRTLADALGISRIPVLNAFEQLIAEGYFESRRGSGTFVARGLGPTAGTVRRSASDAAVAPGSRLVASQTTTALSAMPQPWLQGSGAFRMSEPALDAFPRRAWARLVARTSRNMAAEGMAYASPMGPLRFRQAVAAYLRTARGVRCEAEQIMVVSGSQQALGITARVLLGPGQSVWVEEPGYGGARDALSIAGARLVAVPVDESGLSVAAGMKRCPQPRAVVVTPSHQYPLGVTMPAARRLQLLDWARTTGAWVIEDDYDSEYRYDGHPVTALQGLDRDDRVIYVGTFSKVLFPALRLGYVVIPPDLVERFAAVRDAMDICPPSLYPAVLADFITEGHFARHLRRTRAIYAERRRTLVDALRRDLRGRVEIVGAEAGMHLTAMLTNDARDQPIAERAAGTGLWVMPLSSCYQGPARRQGLVLGYGGTPVAQIRGAVRRLARLLSR